jgi:hypothetical protein
MGKSSEEFIRQREREQELIPLVSSSMNWREYFTKLGQTYIHEEK